MTHIRFSMVSFYQSVLFWKIVFFLGGGLPGCVMDLIEKEIIKNCALENKLFFRKKTVIFHCGLCHVKMTKRISCFE